MKGWKPFKFYTNLLPQRMQNRFFAVFLILCIAAPAFSQSSDLLFDNTFSDKIKTVQLYPKGDKPIDQVTTPVIALKGRIPLFLEFDELYEDAYYYQARIIHCNADWSKSSLSDIQFLADYNEFNISNYEYSFGTTVPYVHYTFEVPPVKLPGNYILVVYRENEPDNVVLSRRFLVAEQKVTFSDRFGMSALQNYGRNEHRVAFDVDYTGIEIVNPANSVTVNILQNHRWDNARLNVPPTFVKEAQNIIEYRNFTEVSTFPAGNEFRFFDMRSIKYFGQYIKGAKMEAKANFVWVEDDKPRTALAYSIDQDINGRYFIENLERRIAAIENDYARVYFTLKSAKVDGRVYIAGKLTDWRYDTSNQMKWNSQEGFYEGSLMLKQGFYNYQYVVTGGSGNMNQLEGNHGETENQYQVFFYYRPPNLQADLLIGYLNLDRNQRP